MDANLTHEEREEFIRLCQAAHAAALAGRHYNARLYFRQAAEIFPFSTSVWFWLAKVVDNEEDRRAALENVLAINPDHREARQQLSELKKRG
jgi:hypothetical protein